MTRRRDGRRSSPGTLHGFWQAFGAYDGFTSWEAPDDVSRAAVALAKAAAIKYRPPGS